jgi:hypothetical protein
MKDLKELLKEHAEIGWKSNPEFNKTRKCHDWRNYIPESVQELWKDMSSEARIIAYLVAKPQADRENWD